MSGSFFSEAHEESASLLDHGCCSTKMLAYVSAFLVFLALFKLRTPLQFYVKYVTYVLIIMVSALVVLPFSIMRPKDPQNINMVNAIMTRILRVFGHRVHLRNSKNLQLSEPYILICNHQSSLDLIVMMDVWPGGNCTVLAKKELLYAGPFGLVCYLLGVTFIDRLHPEKARGTINKLVERIKNENLRIWIYPEGTRNHGSELLPFKKGAFHLAVQAQIPIVCVVTSSYLDFYNKKEKKWLNNGDILVSVLEPFKTAGLSLDSVGDVTKQLQEKMQKEFERLNNELAQKKDK